VNGNRLYIQEIGISMLLEKQQKKELNYEEMKKNSYRTSLSPPRGSSKAAAEQYVTERRTKTSYVLLGELFEQFNQKARTRSCQA
jgi:hypothetical protein